MKTKHEKTQDDYIIQYGAGKADFVDDGQIIDVRLKENFKLFVSGPS